MPTAPSPERPRRVLMLAHRVPYPPDKGDRIRTFHLLRWISRRAEVHLACLADEPVADDTLTALRALCERVAVIPCGGNGRWARAMFALARGRSASEGAFESGALAATLDAWAEEARYDVALASASSLAPYLRRPRLRDIPAVLDLVDVDSQKWLDYAAATAVPKAWLYQLEGRRLRGLEREVQSWARAVLLVSEREADLYRRHCPPGACRVVTNGVDLATFRPQADPGTQDCLFVGALDYRPNVDAAQWFAREAWPEIRRRLPAATFTLVGRRPVPSVRRLAGIAGVRVVGQVPDVRPHLAEAAAVVVPLRIARGVQNKVLEALAMGKATVASPAALEGLDLRPGEHILESASPPEWVEAVSRLLADAPLRARLGAAGRRQVERTRRWDRCLSPLESILDLPAEPARRRDRAASTADRP